MHTIRRLRVVEIGYKAIGLHHTLPCSYAAVRIHNTIDRSSNPLQDVTVEDPSPAVHVWHALIAESECLLGRLSSVEWV